MGVLVNIYALLYSRVFLNDSEYRNGYLRKKVRIFMFDVSIFISQGEGCNKWLKIIPHPVFRIYFLKLRHLTRHASKLVQMIATKISRFP